MPHFELQLHAENHDLPIYTIIDISRQASLSFRHLVVWMSELISFFYKHPIYSLSFIYGYEEENISESPRIITIEFLNSQKKHAELTVPRS
jgi:hypothetical protein